MRRKRRDHKWPSAEQEKQWKDKVMSHLTWITIPGKEEDEWKARQWDFSLLRAAAHYEANQKTLKKELDIRYHYGKKRAPMSYFECFGEDFIFEAWKEADKWKDRITTYLRIAEDKIIWWFQGGKQHACIMQAYTDEKRQQIIDRMNDRTEGVRLTHNERSIQLVNNHPVKAKLIEFEETPIGAIEDGDDEDEEAA